MPKQNPEIRLQITLVSPIQSVMFALQRGKDELVDKTLSSGADLAFSFVVNYVLADDQPDFRGPFVQGPRGGRFVYINSGELADQASSPWRRRAKIPLGGIQSRLLAECASTPSLILSAHIAGRSKDGGPPAASVPLLKNWEVVLGSYIAKA